MTHRDYEGHGIIVHWDSERCIHSERCVMGAPTVFDRRRRPWVDVTGGSADDIARVIDTCPSGALGYTRTDGIPQGRRGSAPERSPAGAPVTITPLRNGPLSVEGTAAIVDHDQRVEVIESALLCRCGHSASKPHCDGTHMRIGFTAPGASP